MYLYGITFNNGHSNIYESKKDIKELIEYLNSAKWVVLNIKSYGDWITADMRLQVKFKASLVNIDEITTIDFIEEE